MKKWIQSIAAISSVAVLCCGWDPVSAESILPDTATYRASLAASGKASGYASVYMVATPTEDAKYGKMMLSTSPVVDGVLTQEYLFLDPELDWYIRNDWQWGGFVITASAEVPTMESLGLTELQASIPDMKLMPYDQACYDRLCDEDLAANYCSCHPEIEPGENQYYLQVPSDNYFQDYDTISTLLRQNESLEQVQDFYLFVDGRTRDERYFSRGSLSYYSAEQLDLQQETGLEIPYIVSEKEDGTIRYIIRCKTIRDLVQAVSCLEQCDAFSRMEFYPMGSAYMLREIFAYPGDVDNDRDITLSDATAILTKYTETAVGGTYAFQIEDSLQALAQFNADYNGDGIIDLEDATAVLTKYCESAVKK